MMNANTVSILRSFHGLCVTGSSRPDPQALMRGFAGIQSSDDDRFKTESFVIKKEESFLAFIALIPKSKMQFVPHPEPNDDPLLQRPEINFDEQMLLVITSHDPNRLIDLDIVRIELTSGGMRVLCTYAAPGPVVSKIIGMGRYCAVMVHRFE